MLIFRRVRRITRLSKNAANNPRRPAQWKPENNKIKRWEVINESINPGNIKSQLTYDSTTDEFQLTVKVNGERCTLKKGESGFDKLFSEMIVNQLHNMRQFCGF